ncbi:MAG: S49 family peptidase [Desulfococcaceae bacterium]|nr:S49 family peptidase [Desulfococcaceae bacterium]
MFGEITDRGREKTAEKMANIHHLFKKHVAMHRSRAEIKKVTTGEFWYAARALELHLVDELMTSDDLLLARSRSADIYEIRYHVPQTLTQKLSAAIRMMIGDLLQGLPDHLQQAREMQKEQMFMYMY